MQSIHRPSVVAVASGGGHWVQLLRLRPAFSHCDVTYVTTRAGYRAEVAESGFRVVPDSNRWSKWGLLRTAAAISFIVLRTRPDVVISTGAAPGYFAVWFGKRIGARAVWVDSVANVERLSMSGERAGRHVDLWLTQWPHLARSGGPAFRGSVL